MMPANANIEIQDFLIDDHPVFILPDTHTYMEWHVHDFYELVLVVDGFCFHHIQNTVSLVMEGDVLLIKPGVCHQYSGTRECKIINCLFKHEALTNGVMEELLKLPEMFRLDPDSAESFPQIHLDIKQCESFQKGLEQMEKEYRKKAIGWDFKIKTLLHSLLVDYARYCNDYKQQWSAENRYSMYVNRAIQHVAEHYSEDLTVQQLADTVGVSPDYLSRQFRMMTGVAVHDYIQRYRISRSLGYLQQGFAVQEVAEKCGFNSISYFSRVFKKEVGIPPTLYKQRVIEKT